MSTVDSTVENYYVFITDMEGNERLFTSFPTLERAETFCKNMATRPEREGQRPLRSLSICIMQNGSSQEIASFERNSVS